jgi:hypothetical protein
MNVRTTSASETSVLEQLTGMKVTRWMSGVPEHPLLSAANRVETSLRYGIGGASERVDRTLLDAANRVRIVATEDDPIPWDLGELPFAGLTRARARIVRDVLRGYPVRVWSVNDRLYDRGDEGRLGVFETMYLEGDWGWGSPLAAPYDCVFATSWDERDTGPACGSGTSWHLGIGAVARIEVLAADPWFPCEGCGCWRPRTEIVDEAAWMRHDRELASEYYERWNCRRQTEEGYCR